MTAMFPLAVWQSGTLQPSTPVNENALRIEVLQRGAISITSTPPGSPADGDTYILGAAPTGAWSTFAQNDVVLWRSGTWYRFAPFSGWLKQAGAEVRRYSGTEWVVVTGTGGGSVPVQEEGSTVVASPTAINFVGAGVTATASGSVVTVTIPGGGGGSVNDNRWEARIDSFPNTGGFSATGISAPLNTGALLGATVSAADVFSSFPRRFSSATTVAGFRGNDGNTFFLGASARVGGLDSFYRVGVGSGATNADHRFFMGYLASTSVPTDVDPSTLVNCIGLGYDAADTQVQIIHNDGSGTASKIALGAGFPKPSVVNNDMFELSLVSVAGSGEVAYTVREVTSGNTASGTITTDLPTGTTGLNYYIYISRAATSMSACISTMIWRQ